MDGGFNTEALQTVRPKVSKSASIQFTTFITLHWCTGLFCVPCYVTIFNQTSVWYLLRLNWICLLHMLVLSPLYRSKKISLFTRINATYTTTTRTWWKKDIDVQNGEAARSAQFGSMFVDRVQRKNRNIRKVRFFVFDIVRKGIEHHDKIRRPMSRRLLASMHRCSSATTYFSPHSDDETYCILQGRT